MCAFAARHTEDNLSIGNAIDYGQAKQRGSLGDLVRALNRPDALMGMRATLECRREQWGWGRQQGGRAYPAGAEACWQRSRQYNYDRPGSQNTEAVRLTGSTSSPAS